MSIIDIAIGLVIILFVAYGFVFGFVHKLAKLVSLAIGVIVSTHLYMLVFKLVVDYDQGYHNVAKALIYLILVFAISQIFMLLFSILEKALHFISFIPLLPTINKVAGAALGVLIGSICVLTAFFIFAKIGFMDTWINGQLQDSFLIPKVIYVKNVIIPVLPDSLTSLLSIYDYGA